LVAGYVFDTRQIKSAHKFASLFSKTPKPEETSIPTTPLWFEPREFDSMSGKGMCLH